MAWTEEQRAELARKRGEAAANIKDKEKRRKFIAEQGDAESKGKVSDDDYKTMRKKADDTIATEGKNFDADAPSQKVIGSFKKGGKVRRTGIYRLHKGEEVNPVRHGKAKNRKKALKR